jgi:hypothetical protein
VSPQPDVGRALWRVGYHADPLGFTPGELYEFSHRFDDIHRRFRTLYCAELPETCLREVLADFRPNLGALRRHVERYGPEAAQDFTPEPVTAQWRSQQARTKTDGLGTPICVSGEMEDNGNGTVTCLAIQTRRGDGLTPQENQQLNQLGTRPSCETATRSTSTTPTCRAGAEPR